MNSDSYRGFPLTVNEALRFVESGKLPEGFKGLVENWLEFGGCANCDGVRCMHMVMRDWWSEDIDRCDGWCCPDCSALKSGVAAVSETKRDAGFVPVKENE